MKDTGRMFKCLICGKEFESEGTDNYRKEHRNKDDSYTTLIPYKIYCPHCSSRFSKKEKDVLTFIKTIYKGTIAENIKGLFPSRPQMELDIYLPELNLGIEFDGTYWHSFRNVQDRDTTKDALCEEKGIHLLRIKESDWDNNPDKVKEEIKYFLSEGK